MFPTVSSVAASDISRVQASNKICVDRDSSTGVGGTVLRRALE